MSEAGQCAYITGGASGIGRAITEMLVKKGAKVFIADRDISAASLLATSLNTNKDEPIAFAAQVDVTSWDQQVACFQKAVDAFGGRVDYVFPIAGIGERRWIPTREETKTKEDGAETEGAGFVKPDLTVVDADLTGVLWTVGVAVQQFRRQGVGRWGFRGKIGCVASVCGFYCVPTLPIYTAAKHAVTGFVRSYGKYLPEEHITLNSVNPHVIRTAISSGAFYDMVEAKGLLTPMEGLIEAFESMLGDREVSGEVFEIPPGGGWKIRAAPEYLDEKSRELCEMLEKRSRVLHTAK